MSEKHEEDIEKRKGTSGIASLPNLPGALLLAYFCLNDLPLQLNSSSPFPNWKESQETTSRDTQRQDRRDKWANSIIFSLPSEIQHRIFVETDPVDLAALSSTCRAFHSSSPQEPASLIYFILCTCKSPKIAVLDASSSSIADLKAWPLKRILR
jgi:hypothetical protein